ncbi:MAG: hypothetical protein LBT62_07705 [Deltaproteobacteria bacterium]|nr:hypothetical protein [Deltaproteobacteria bacterium]
MNKYKKQIMIVLSIAAAFFAFWAGLMEYRASGELEKARAFREASNYEAADRHYFQALNWYAPWGSSQTAAEELMELGREHLGQGRHTQAYQSFLRLRGGLMAARSFYLPRADLIEAANPFIALYLAEQKLGPQASRDEINAQAQLYLQLYAENPPIGEGWHFLTIAGFLGWVIAGFRLIAIFFDNRRLLNVRQRFQQGRAVILLFICAYGLWLFSMTRA